MSRKKRGAEKAPPPRRRWLAGAAVLALLAVAGATFALYGWRQSRGGTGPTSTIPFPEPRAAVADATPVTLADFAGAESCASCHASQYVQWKKSVHGRAGGPASPDVVIAPFDGTPIRFRDATVTPVVRGGQYLFEIAQPGRAPTSYRVDGVIGGGHMEGGGTQGFVTRWADGTVRFLPFDFARQQRSWFCNTGTRANHGWVPISSTMSIFDCGDWPPQRVLGDEPRFSNCQGCHGSQITVAFDSTKHRYATSWTSLAVNCESCHGPARRHVELARTGAIARGADIGLRSLATLDKDASLGVCFQCHAVKDQVQRGYLPGKSLAAYYSVKMPLLGDRPFFPDGRVRTFAYQQGHLYSACYRNGSMTCASCHAPHAGSYRDVNGRALDGRFDDRQCTSCHASKAEPIEAHTRHPAASAGSRCVACHMPYQQQPELGNAVRYARSDHTIAIPRPGFDEQLGITSACARCHTDRSADALARQVTDWYGTVKPLPAVVRALADAEQSGDAPRALAPSASAPADNHLIGQFAALARVVESALAPNMTSLPDATVTQMKEWAASPDLDLRALALAALHYARGGDAGVRRFLVERLAAQGPDDLAVRRRWVLVLGYLGDSFRTKGDAATAIVTYRKALELLPADASVLTNLGLAYTDAGDFAAAAEALRRSATLRPQALTLVNLGIALERSADIPGATAAYEQAIALDPHEALAYLNLGNIAYNRDDPARAAALYTKAAESDAGRAPIFFNLARAQFKLREPAKALEAVRRGLEIEPASEEGRGMAAELERALGRGQR